MVLVDYIGIFFTFPNTFDRWLYTFSLNIYTFFLSLYWILFSCIEKKYTTRIKIWANKQTKYRQFRMFWCKICYNLSRNYFTIFFWKNMVLVDYTGIFFYISQYFWQMTVYIFFKYLYIFFIFILNFMFMPRKKNTPVLFMIQKDIEMFFLNC
jgi:hypothetical protein